MLCPCDTALDGASNTWLFDDHLCHNDYNKSSSYKSSLPSSLPMLRGSFTPHPFSCYYSPPALSKHMVIQSEKTTISCMPWFSFIINNTAVIKMSIRIPSLVTPFLLVYVMIMGTRDCLSAFSATHTAIGWWWCVPVILFPWRFK